MTLPDLSWLGHPSLQFFNKLLGEAGTAQQGYQQGLGNFDTYLTQQNTEADRLKGLLETELAAPEPESSPYARATSITLGSLASAMNPRISPDVGTKQLDQNVAALRERRTRRLQTLEKLYADRADRAGKLGDFKAQQELLTKAELQSKALEKLFGEEKALADDARLRSRDKESDERRHGHNMEELQVQGRTARDVARIGASSRVDRQEDKRTLEIAKMQMRMYSTEHEAAQKQLTAVLRNPKRKPAELQAARDAAALASRRWQRALLRQNPQTGAIVPATPAEQFAEEQFSRYISPQVFRYSPATDTYAIDAKGIANMREDLKELEPYLITVGLTPGEAEAALLDFARMVGSNAGQAPEPFGPPTAADAGYSTLPMTRGLAERIASMKNQR